MVAVQTMWRSCGTYIWSKFREDAYFHAYDEPLHEKLLGTTQESFQREKEEGVEARLRHPAMDRHYFAEYPLQTGGGVPFFEKRFSFERYFMQAEESDPELRQYLAHLIACAHRQGRRPVAKFCRAGLRTAWLARNFSPLTIYLLRDPEAMFRSYWSFGGPQSYFLFALAMIVSKNRECVLFAEAAEQFKIPYVEKESVQEELREIYALTREFDPQAWRDLFLLFWALHLKHNAAYCELLLDVDLLAMQRPYRERMEEEINRAFSAGLSASFSTSFSTSFPPRLLARVSLADARLSSTAEAPGMVVSPDGATLARNALRNLPEETNSSYLSRMNSSNMSDCALRAMGTIL